MTSPVYPVFEGDGGVNAPKRPTADVDLGGLSFIDSVKYPPKDRERLSATDYMQATMSLERVARMIPVLIVDATLVTSPSAMPLYVLSVNDALTTANVTISETGTGAYRVTIPSGKLPTAAASPEATIIGNGSGVCMAGITASTATTFDIIVRDYAGSATTASSKVRLRVY